MHIGILTFHWATNYGAVLQCYALQRALEKIGHTVKVINYQPLELSDNILGYLLNRRFLHPYKYVTEINKDKNIETFRRNYLKLSKRISRQKNVSSMHFDCVISGSDQVLNPSFLKSGELGGATIYFLDFWPANTKRVMYAVSFGVTSYPKKLMERVKPLIKKISKIGVREESGAEIMSMLDRKDANIVPDPTLLLQQSDYMRFISRKLVSIKNQNYIFAYFLRKPQGWIDKFITGNDDPIVTLKTEGIESWLSCLYFSKIVLTNSFHCVVFSLLFHRPFVVVLDTIENTGMNDRFYTLLSKCGLTDRIIKANDITKELNSDRNYNWTLVDEAINAFRSTGLDFLNGI